MKVDNNNSVIGEMFGRLMPILELEPEIREYNGRVHKYRRVLAVCECGDISEYYLHHLRSGHTYSCGCYIPEKRIETQEKLLIPEGTNLSITRKLDPNADNKLRERNIYKTPNETYRVSFQRYGVKVYQKTFKTLEAAIEARDAFVEREKSEELINN